MATTQRREFLRSAVATSAAMLLTGDVGRAATLRGPGYELDVENQIDPWIELDLDALVSNVREIRRRIEGRPIMAVVKCNAYGHGDVEIATALQRAGEVDRFMVVNVREALRLRRNGVRGLILNAGPFSRGDVSELLNQDISQAVYSERVRLLSEEAQRQGKLAKIHIYLDTGMGRVGVPHDEALAFIEEVASLPNLRIEGTLTAMTEDDDFNPVQIERLERVYAEAGRRGIEMGIRHAAATAEVDRHPYAWLDMVRPGNCLVGLEPERQRNMEIQPVMAFKTRVIYVKTLQKGDALSYHRAYRIDEETRIATLPCGYSDGYPPVVTNQADVLIRGRRHRVVAPVTANHMMVDVTGAPEVAIGDEVVLWGRQGDERITKVELESFAPDATNTYRMATRTRTYLPRIVRPWNVLDRFDR